MSDQRLRSRDLTRVQQRHERIRHGLNMQCPQAPRVVACAHVAATGLTWCPACEGGEAGRRSRCHVVEQPLAPTENWLSWRAYLGCEEARSLLPHPSHAGWAWADDATLHDWLAGLAENSARLSALVVRSAQICPACGGSNRVWEDSSPYAGRTKCPYCTISSKHYYSIWAALAAGRAVHPGEHFAANDPCQICRAFAACAAWLACPCLERLEAWQREAISSPAQPIWVIRPTLLAADHHPVAIPAAGNMVGDAVVRLAVCKALLNSEVPYG